MDLGLFEREVGGWVGWVWDGKKEGRTDAEGDGRAFRFIQLFAKITASRWVGGWVEWDVPMPRETAVALVSSTSS